MTLFSEADRVRIEGTIADVERRSAGEIVVAEVGRSHDYALHRTTAAALAAVASVALIHVLWPVLFFGWLLFLQLPIAAGFWTIFGTPPFLRGLLNPSTTRLFVHKRALLMFAEQGIFRTRDRTGLLILLSRLERQVVILGDEGIHQHVGADGWSQYVDKVVHGIHAGKAADAVIEVLHDYGAHLEKHLPIRPGDTNELDNRVVQER